VDKQRPINLALTTIKFPIMAIASIMHRISGVLLYLFIPFLLWLFAQSLASKAAFANAQAIVTSSFGKFFIWIMLSGLVYHLIAGIRHMVMDLGFGEGLSCGRWSARIVIAISAVFILIIGCYLW